MVERLDWPDCILKYLHVSNVMITTISGSLLDNVGGVEYTIDKSVQWWKNDEKRGNTLFRTHIPPFSGWHALFPNIFLLTKEEIWWSEENFISDTHCSYSLV